MTNSYDIPESQVQSERLKLNQQGYREGIPLSLRPGEFSITPRYSERTLGNQLMDEREERIFSVSVQT